VSVLTHPLRTYSSSNAYTASIGSVEFSIDTLDGTARLRDPSTGEEVYSELSPSQAAQFAELTATIAQGQAWYDATASLNPLENAPPGWQPQSTVLAPELANTKGAVSLGALDKQTPASSVRDLIELAKTKGAVPLGTMDSKNVRARVIAVLRVSDRSVITSMSTTSRRSNLIGGVPFADDYPQYTQCMDIAQSIAYDRLAYLNSRNWLSSNAKEIISGQAMAIISRFGKNWVEGPDLVQALMAAGMAGAEAMNNSIALAVKTTLYNSYNCQGVIAISRPIPGRIGFGSGGGSKIARCQEVWLQYEISYDGGLTWYQIEVKAMLCQEEQA
jgi:hypothetical protein